MLESIAGLPDHVVAYRATGKVTEEDLNTVLVPVIEQKMEAHEKVHYLIVMENETGDWSLGGYGKDPKAALKYIRKGSRVAVISSQQNVRTFASGLSLFIPGKAKGFEPEELEEAKAWMLKKDEDDFLA